MQKRKVKFRSVLIGAIFLLLFFGIVYRFFVLQVVDAAWYQERAERMWNSESKLESSRGSIYDRNGQTLAQEAAAYTVVAVIDENAEFRVEDPVDTAKQLAGILPMSQEELVELMTQEDRYQVELRPGGWKVTPEVMEHIRDLELPGIIFNEESKRYYPNNDFASHVIGFLNHEEEPVMGLESFLNDYLSGEDGYITFDKDGEGKRLPQGTQGVKQPVHGHHVYLTLDSRIQLYVEQALDEAYKEYRPENMTVIVSDPHSGEILGMANRSSFNPNDFANIDNYVNNAISNPFEPGSTFKIVTLAAAIEEGIFNPTETFQSGVYDQVPGDEVIRDHTREGWGAISFLEGVQRSSNVAFAILGWERMKRETFYHYIHGFGFGALTGIDLPNEHRGYVKPMEGTPPIDVANMTFGQGISVTPLQQLQAAAVIANGGQLIQPYIVDRIVDPSTEEIIHENELEIIEEQVISKQTAQEVADILETVVTDGTGRNNYIEGYQVAGKTGTAQKIGENGNYISGQYVHSFVGMAPKEDPQLVVFVSVDTPQVGLEDSVVALGSSVVAQIFKPVMQNSLQYLNVFPDVEETEINWEEEGEIMEDYQGQSMMSAREHAEANGFEVIPVGNGSTVVDQYPAGGETIYDQHRLYLASDSLNQTVLPDFSGWSLREVKEWGSIAQMKVKTSGEGYVYQQSVAEGQVLRKGEHVEVRLQSPHD